MESYANSLRRDWNETGFRVGVGKRKKIITNTASGKIYIPNADDRAYITVVECVQADGGSIPPKLIQQGQTHLEEHFPSDLPKDVLFAVSPLDDNNDELFLEWLRHYETHTRSEASQAVASTSI